MWRNLLIMNDSKGVLVIARNNQYIDYVKQAAYLAARVKTHLGLPTSIVTDSMLYLEDQFPGVFDNVIPLEYTNDSNYRLYFDGALSKEVANFKNSMRADAYDLSPYDQTLLLDTDVVVCNDLFKQCFDSVNDFQLYRNATDISNVRSEIEFDYISDYSVDFYWATCVFFRKTDTNKIFFDLVKHVYDEWEHYRRVYQLSSKLFRNDFAFSIAIHIMNGFRSGNFASPMPGKLLYVTDRDILWNIDQDNLMILVEKENHLGEYTPIRTSGQTVHVMNKTSLTRVIDEDSYE